jgi:hypothetical protein
MRPDALDHVGGWDLEVKAAHSEGGGHGSLLMIEKFLNVQIGLLPPAHRGIFWSLKVAQKFSLAIYKQISLEPFFDFIPNNVRVAHGFRLPWQAGWLRRAIVAASRPPAVARGVDG